MDAALLGWRESCLEVENSLEDRGHEERSAHALAGVSLF